MTSGSEPVALGEDILLYEGCDERQLELLSNRHKFLDVLWLPCSLEALRPEQIFTINRFRERKFSADAQFKQANLSRQALLLAIQSSGADDVTEIGCGKFPLATDICGISYRAIEIDPEARDFCRSSGISILEYPLEENGPFKSKLFVSLYAMHFAVDRHLVEFITARLDADGCIVFNAIVDDSTAIIAKLKSLTENFPIIRIVKEDRLSKREFFFVLSRPEGALLAHKLSQSLSTSLKS